MVHKLGIQTVRLYDALYAIAYAIKNDPEASPEMKTLARKGTEALNGSKAVG